MASPALSIRDLSLRIRHAKGAVALLDEVSLTIAPGEVLALVGESGSGKSLTALSCLALHPEGAEMAGRIEIGGRSVLDASAAGLRQIRGGLAAMVFQKPASALNPFLTVGRQIRDVARLRQPARADPASVATRIAKAMSDVRLADPGTMLTKYPHQLSGGQLQRFMIAMALIGDPLLLIADEPTTALDATVQSQLLAVIADLARDREMAVLLITHDLAVAASVAHRIAVMYAGRIVEIGPRDAVLDRPGHPYAAGLVSIAPELGRHDDWLVTIPGTVPHPAERVPGCAFAPRCGREGVDCRTVAPDLLAADGGHAIRCHHPVPQSGAQP